ncbi:MAG: hypothetical protein JZU72_00060 [Chlorobium phaeobacteroides]|jgi:hypothetical protein|nr:hypothetical protein [Chlorobium phaeobacteroides]
MNKHIFPFLLRVFFILSVCLYATDAFAGEWVLLGKKSVSLIAERDVIPVKRSAEFRKIKIAVRDRGIEFYRLVAVYGNGRRHSIPARNFIHAGGETRAIDLPGTARVIRKIILEYRSIPGSFKRAEVQVWGLKN